MTVEDFVADTTTAPVAVRVRGEGPGVILLPGGMQTAADFDRLATILSRQFRTIVVDRRGRGDSRNLPPLGGIDAEARDVHAVAKAFDARYLFGFSSGALIALNTAVLATDSLEAVALYEPPLRTPGFSSDFDWIDEVENLLTSGQSVEALTRMTGVIGDHPIVRKLPRSILRCAASAALRFGRAAIGDPLSTVLPTFAQDARVVRDARSLFDELGPLPARFLLVNGARAASPLVGALDGLERRLPNAERRVLHRVGHIAASNGGSPKQIGALLRDFFE